MIDMIINRFIILVIHVYPSSSSLYLYYFSTRFVSRKIFNFVVFYLSSLICFNKLETFEAYQVFPKRLGMPR